MDPHLGTALFALMALVIGAVVFGGTTLAYFLDERRSHARKPVPERRGISHLREKEPRS